MIKKFGELYTKEANKEGLAPESLHKVVANKVGGLFLTKVRKAGN